MTESSPGFARELDRHIADDPGTRYDPTDDMSDQELFGALDCRDQDKLHDEFQDEPCEHDIETRKGAKEWRDFLDRKADWMREKVRP